MRAEADNQIKGTVRTRRTRTGLLVCALVIVGLLASASAAFADTGVVSFFGGRGTIGGKFGGVAGVAVNQLGAGGVSAGDIYVLDGHRIQEFSRTGAFVRAFGLDVGGPGVDVCTAAASCQPGTASAAAGGILRALPSEPNREMLAIDQSTGDIFVNDIMARRVDVFSAEGVFEGGFGWNVKATGGAEELQFCTTASGCKQGTAGTGPGQFNITAVNEGTTGPEAIAVSPLNGHVVVADSINRRVSEFEPIRSGGAVTGVSFVRGYGWGAVDGAEEFQICTTSCHSPAPGAPPSQPSAPGQFGTSETLGNHYAPEGVAVGPHGTIYASEGNGIQAFTSEGDPLGFVSLEAESVHPRGTIVINEGDETMVFYATVTRDHVTRTGLFTFGLDGHFVEYFSGPQSFQGKAFDEVSGSMYFGLDHREERLETVGVFKLGEAVPPEATIEPATEVTGTTASLHGMVNPRELFTEYRFEYSTDGENWTAAISEQEREEEEEDRKNDEPGKRWLPAVDTPLPVDRKAEGLEGLTEYQVRLVATKLFSSGTGIGYGSLETGPAPALASAVTVSDVDSESALLSGTVNPENEDTTYEFQYVTEAEFAEGGFAHAGNAGSGTVAAAGAPVEVQTQLGGLTPGTGYVVRLVAENGTSPAAESPPTPFATYPRPIVGLPDGRAYEQASPVDKGGSDIQGGEYNVHAGEGGGAITFYVNGGLPNSGDTGGQQFPTYTALRDGGGWSSHGLLPPSRLGRKAVLVGWSEDGSRSYSVVGEPGGDEALYRRDTATGQETLIADGVESELQGEGFVSTNVAGESADGNIVVFEAYEDLLPKARADKPNVYAWNATTGELTLVSVLPNGKSPIVGGIAGPYDWAFGNSVGAGGPAGGYYSREENVVSSAGTSVYFTDAITHQVYLRRLDAEETVQVSASRKTNGSGVNGADPLGPKPAAFLGASSDGSKSFFLSSEKLTNDATTGPNDEGRDLYRYDAATEALTDLVPDRGDPSGARVQAVLGISADGSAVYFLANGVLAEGASEGTCNASSGLPTSGKCNLYVWHEGQVELIAAEMEAGDRNSEATGRNWLPASAAGSSVLDPKVSTVSPDGSTLQFVSAQRLTSYDSGGHNEVYRYRLGAGLLCVSCNPSGLVATSGATLHKIPSGFTSAPPPNSPSRLRSMSRSGDRIVFQTEERLVPGDDNSTLDVYEWEADGSGSCTGAAGVPGGCLYLISTGQSPRPSYFVDADAELNNIFFLTAQQLVGQDTDELIDVYDARVGGGLASQNPPPPSPACEGEACRGPAQVAPPSIPRGTATFIGPPNPKRAHKHKQRHRRHKRHHHGHKKRHPHGKKHGKRHHGKRKGKH